MRSVEDILLQLNLLVDDLTYPFFSSVAPYHVASSCCIMHLHAAHDHCAAHDLAKLHAIQAASYCSIAELMYTTLLPSIIMLYISAAVIMMIG